ncbi:MAG: hypothetical protein IJN54_14450 [Lachnospiraceae bacterium]|nr:hypothetical protein [Lachnospiraceae bacterium]
MIHDEECLGVMVYMESPTEKGMKLITAYNEIFVNNFVCEIIEKIKEYAPIPFSKLLEEIYAEHPQKNKDEICEIIEHLLKHEIIETMDDVW